MEKSRQLYIKRESQARGSRNSALSVFDNTNP